MNKTTKTVLIIAIIVLLIFGVALAVYNHFKAEPMDANTTGGGNVLDNANNGLENLINDILDEENEESANNEQNTDENNNTTNIQASNTQTQNQSSNNVGANTENQTTPGEQKAVELVKESWKKEWGNLNDVSFNNVMIQGDGKYVVSVNDSKTTKVIRRYVVDTVTGLVEEK